MSALTANTIETNNLQAESGTGEIAISDNVALAATKVVKTDAIQDSSGNAALDLTKLAGNAGRYARQVYVQNDTTSRSFSTSWSLGATFTNVSGFKEGSLVEVTYYIPLRNDSTTWGGAYIEPQVTFNNSTWLSCGSSGYTAVMEYGQSIGYYQKSLLIDPSLESITGDFQFNIRFYLRSYDGTLTSISNNSINSVSGTVTSLSATQNYYQHYASIIVREWAVMRGSS